MMKLQVLFSYAIEWDKLTIQANVLCRNWCLLKVIKALAQAYSILQVWLINLQMYNNMFFICLHKWGKHGRQHIVTVVNLLEEWHFQEGYPSSM
jgi:hypothetical protein